MTIKEHLSILPHSFSKKKKKKSILPHSHFPPLILIHLTYENIPSSMHPLDLTLSIPNKFFFYFIILSCTIFYFPWDSMKTTMNQVYGLTDSNVLWRTSSYQVEQGLVRQSMHAHLLVSLCGLVRCV